MPSPYVSNSCGFSCGGRYGRGGICSLPTGPVRQGKQGGPVQEGSRSGQYGGGGGCTYIITSWSHHNKQPVKQQRRYLFKALSPLMYWNILVLIVFCPYFFLQHVWICIIRLQQSYLIYYISINSYEHLHRCRDNTYNMCKLWASMRAATTTHSVQLIGKMWCIYTRNIVWDEFGSMKTIKQKHARLFQNILVILGIPRMIKKPGNFGKSSAFLEKALLFLQTTKTWQSEKK